MNNQPTICAISTAAGVGGIAVVRVSGENSIKICNKIFMPANKNKCLLDVESNRMLFGKIYNSEEELTDEVLVCIFRCPHSFTGEDTVEISCHGSIYIQQEILKTLIENGCELAKPGEFTQRAFLNGKLDLSQAEAVADLINSTSAMAHKVAINQMRGNFSTELKNLREKLLEFTSLVELELDFNEEDVEFADRKKLSNLISKIEEYINKLCKSFEVGNVIKNGVPVAIVGETNVGKSTLLNTLLNEERAIVSDIHGTTRDAIEDTVNIEGIVFRFIDTAGIRDTKDKIEIMGIEKTYEKIKKASIILWLTDASKTIAGSDVNKMKDLCEDKKLIIVRNKSDLVKKDKINLDNAEVENISISAKSKKNIDKLQKMLVKASRIKDIGTNEVIITNIRHLEALKNAMKSISGIKTGIESGISQEFLAQDIRECIYYLGTITGDITSDEILGSIFSRFCIGK